LQAQIAQMEADHELAEAIAEKEQAAIEKRRRRLESAQRELQKEQESIEELERRYSVEGIQQVGETTAGVETKTVPRHD
jgi:predicted metal-dependent hydrolase